MLKNKWFQLGTFLFLSLLVAIRLRSVLTGDTTPLREIPVRVVELNDCFFGRLPLLL
jgi:hypothetical protein